MSIRFDAASERLTRADKPSATFSVCWFGRLLSSGGGYKHFFSIDNAVDDWLQFGTNTGTATIGLWSDSNDVTFFTASVNAWYFMGFTRDAAGTCTYYHGAVGSALSTGTIALGGIVAGSTLKMGGSGFDEFCNGEMAGIRIWDGVELSAAEMAQEARQLAPVRYANLWLFTPLHNTNEVVDLSGNGRSWTKGGSPTTGAQSPPVPYRAGKRRPLLTVASSGFSSSVTADANAVLQAPVTVTVDANAVLQAAQAVTADADAIISAAAAVTLDADAILQAQQAATVAATAVLQDEVVATAAATAVMQDAVTVSADADAVVQTAESVSASASAIIEASSTVEVDAAAVVQTELTVAADAGAVVQSDRTVTADANALVQTAESISAAADTVIGGAFTAELAATAIIQAALDETVDANALVQAEVTVTADADANIQSGSSVTVEGSAIVQAAVEVEADLGAVVQAEVTAIATADAIVQAAFEVEADVNALVQTAEAATIAANTVINAAQSVTVEAATVLQDAVTATASGNAIMQEALEATADADAAVATSEAVTAGSSAVIEATIEGTVTVGGSAVLVVIEQDASASGDAIIALDPSTPRTLTFIETGASLTGRHVGYVDLEVMQLDVQYRIEWPEFVERFGVGPDEISYIFMSQGEASVCVDAFESTYGLLTNVGPDPVTVRVYVKHHHSIIR